MTDKFTEQMSARLEELAEKVKANGGSDKDAASMVMLNLFAMESARAFQELAQALGESPEICLKVQVGSLINGAAQVARDGYEAEVIRETRDMAYQMMSTAADNIEKGIRVMQDDSRPAPAAGKAH